MHPPSIPDYTLEELLGDGCTGSVWLARYHGGPPLALKAFRGLAINRQLVSDALVRIYEAAQHPGIAKIIDFDLANPQAYVALELCAEEVKLADGRTVWKPRTLETRCGALPADEAWGLAGQIADSLAYLHRKRIVHANLKPSNVLFGEGESAQPMLSDFGQGLVGGIEQIDMGASAFYAAPEQLSDPDHFFEGRAERWDVYRFGVTIYRLLTGRLPRLDEAAREFTRSSSRELELADPIDLPSVAAALHSETEIHWPAPAESDLERSRRHIIETCLRLEPGERYVDMREVVEALRDAEHEQEHLGEIEEFEEVKGELATAAKGAKRRATLFGAAAAVAAGVAAFALVDRFGGKDEGEDGNAPPPTAASPAGGDGGNNAAPTESAAEQEAKSQLAGTLDDLHHSQAALDSLFEMIAARDAQGRPLYDVPDGALGKVLNYYEEFSNRHFGHPEHADQVAVSLNNAGELKMILGDLPGAVANLAGAAEMLDNLETGGGEPGALLQRRARTYTNLSDAQSASGLPEAAVISAQQADSLYQRLAESPETDPAAPQDFAASSLLLGRKLYEANRRGEAGIYVERAASILKPLEEAGTANEEDLATLAATAFERGRIERASGEREAAIKSQIEAVDRFLALIEARPEIDDYRFQLARTYGEAAELASLLGEPGEASSANAESAALLRSLAAAAPEHSPYRYELARRLRSIADSFRDAGDASKARAEQEKSIVLLEDLVESHPNEPEYTYELALVSGIHADLLGEAKQLDAAIARGRTAVDLMQGLLMSDLDTENDDAKRDRYRHALAALYGKLGHHTERTGDKEAAVHCFEKAHKQYTTLATANPADATATKGVEWADGRIERLK